MEENEAGEFELSIHDDEEEDIHEYGVVCGFLGMSIRLRVETPEQARALFTALQTVKSVDET